MDPIRLSAHLEDYHGQHPGHLAVMDSDDLRALHVRLHAASSSHHRPHVHWYGDPGQPVARSS